MENIFTATQQRRNDKAIAAAIAEHGDSLVPSMIDSLADANAEIERLQEKNIEIERELRQVQDELEERTAELEHEEEQHEALKKQHKAAADAMEAMAALQDCEVTYGTALQATLYRVSMGLAVDSWDDEYVRKDIAEAMRLAEQYAVMIGEEVTGYIEPQHQA